MSPTEVTIEDDPSCAARRLRLWRDVVGDHLADVDLSPAGGLPPSMALRGSLSLRAYERATVARIAAGAQAVHRTPERIRCSGSDVVFVNAVMAGSCRLEQHGSRHRVEAGGICLYDTASPYRIETSFDFSSVLVGMARRDLERRVGDIRPVTGALAPGPTSTVAARYWSALAAGIGGMDRASAEALIEIGLDVLEVAIRAGAEQASATAARSIVERARRAIRQRHSDSGFSARDVAAASGVSIRRLQELLRREGETVTDALHRARLDHARDLLLDPRFDQAPIKVLMSRAGFSDPAHFSRAFKAAFHLGPAAFRSKRQEDAA